MNHTDHLITESFFAVLIVLLIVVVYYTDRRFSNERTRNVRLVTRIQNLQNLVRIQDAIIVAKIDVVLDEHRAQRLLPAADGDRFNVDQVLMSMEYCYTCEGMRGPSHFKDEAHRTSPAPELYGPETVGQS
jgi:hypothetical protein